MVQLLINDAIGKGEETPAVIKFQNAYPTEAMKSVPATILQDPVTKEKIYVCELDGMLYTGKKVIEKHLETAIVKRNKITGKVTVISTDYVEIKPELIEDVEEPDVVHITDILELSRKFGSKKQKQQMEQREKLKINVETVTEQMLKVTDEIREEQVDLTPYTVNDAENFYIPPIDRTAEDVRNVYRIEKILTDDEFEKVSSQLDGKDYLTDMLPWLQGLLAKKQLSQKHTVLAVYANCLLKLYNNVAKEISKKTFAACPHSTTLNEIIIKNFTSQNQGKILRPGPYKDKSLCYAIVLILLINDLKFDLDSLCQALKLTTNNASMKIRATGATVVNSGGKKVVHLKLPLNTKQGFRRKSAKF